MKLENKTKYDSSDLRALILAGLRATGVPSTKVKVRIVYNRHKKSGWHGGRATLGRSEKRPATSVLGEKHVTRHGRWMTLSLPRDEAKIDVPEFARTIVHEALHLRGVQHGEMTEAQRYCKGPCPSWAEGKEIRVKLVKHLSKVEHLGMQLEHAKKFLAMAATRRKRAETIEKKWQKRVRAIERNLAAVDAEEERIAAREPPRCCNGCGQSHGYVTGDPVKGYWHTKCDPERPEEPTPKPPQWDDPDVGLRKAIEETPANCGNCKTTAYVTAEERGRGKWTCYGCGSVNRWTVKS